MEAIIILRWKRVDNLILPCIPSLHDEGLWHVRRWSPPGRQRRQVYEHCSEIRYVRDIRVIPCIMLCLPNLSLQQAYRSDCVHLYGLPQCASVFYSVSIRVDPNRVSGQSHKTGCYVLDVFSRSFHVVARKTAKLKCTRPQFARRELP